MPTRTQFAAHLMHGDSSSNQPIRLFHRMFGRREPEIGRIKRREIKPVDAATVALAKAGRSMRGSHAGA